MVASLGSRHLALLLTLSLVAVLYGLTLPGSITLEDAGIFQMTCHLGGISHPPGYPLFTTICQGLLAGQNAFDHSALAGNLISTLFALAAVAILYFIVLELNQDQWVAAFAALAYGLTRCLWSQAVIIEVYSLAACLFLLSWWVLLRYLATSEVRYWYLLCFVAGLNLSNHWPLFVLSCSGFLPLLIRDFHKFVPLLTLPTILVSLAMVLVGLTPYLALLNADPQIAIYGAVTSENFFPYILREYYSDTHSDARLTDKLQYLSWMLSLSLEQLGWLALPFVAIGAVTAKNSIGLANTISLAFTYVASTFLLTLMLNFRFELQYQAIYYPYPVIAVAPLACFFALGMAWVVRKANLVNGLFGPMIGAVLVFAIIASSFPAVDRSSSRIADAYARAVLQALPANAVLFVEGDNQTGPIGYLNRVQGVRPDVWVQSLDGLLFSDNLLPRSVSDQDRLVRLQQFIQDSPRPVYSMKRLTDLDVDYGLFYAFLRGGEPYVILPRIELFTQYLLAMRQSEYVKDPHERVLLNQLLLDLTRLFSEYAATQGTAAMTLSQRNALQQLQHTFAGRLVSLRTMVVANPATSGLLELGFRLEDQLSEAISKQEGALVFELIGRILLVQGTEQEAESYFYRSIRHHPSLDNLSICEYLRLAEPSVSKAVMLELSLNPQNCVSVGG